MIIDTASSTGARTALTAVVVFLNAFLLFQVEPLLGKILLPWFGGSAAVWSVCLLFFQAALLGGYLYAHLLMKHAAPKWQARIHIALVALSLAWLPIAPSASWKSADTADPSLRILLLLTASAGLPFVLLSATSPLLQAWQARASAASPYRLYALSNVGSMLALLTYPVLFEPRLSTSHQALVWSIAYAGAALLSALLCWRTTTTATTTTQESDAPPVAWTQRALWLLLPACASVLLTATTAHVTQNIAAAPMLWIVPLALYLLSFILCFDAPRWYARRTFLRLLAVALACMGYALSPDLGSLPLLLLAGLYCGGLFVCCMFCHGELVRLKPAPARLTSFYLHIATGSAIGALFAGFVAPHLFAANFELPIALGLCGLLIVAVHARDVESPFYRASFAQQFRTPAWLILVGLVIALCGVLISISIDTLTEPRAIARNFYGVLSVTDTTRHGAPLRKLRNGAIDHGLQWLDAARRRQPTAYYGATTGVGVLLNSAAQERTALRVGVVGLGAGTVAAYGRALDRYTFFELDPHVDEFARAHFTYLKDSAAQTRVELGDGRLLLERVAPASFDVLIVDAFSGDSIPVHLLTLEAMRLYFRTLSTEGTLAVHISNSYLDLKPVVAAAALALGKRATVIENAPDKANAVAHSTWVLIGNSDAALGMASVRKAGAPLNTTRVLQWRDDFSSLFPLLN